MQKHYWRVGQRRFDRGKNVSREHAKILHKAWLQINHLMDEYQPLNMGMSNPSAFLHRRQWIPPNLYFVWIPDFSVVRTNFSVIR